MIELENILFSIFFVYVIIPAWKWFFELIYQTYLQKHFKVLKALSFNLCAIFAATMLWPGYALQSNFWDILQVFFIMADWISSIDSIQEVLFSAVLFQGNRSLLEQHQDYWRDGSLALAPGILPGTCGLVVHYGKTCCCGGFARYWRCIFSSCLLH